MTTARLVAIDPDDLHHTASFCRHRFILPLQFVNPSCTPRSLSSPSRAVGLCIILALCPAFCMYYYLFCFSIYPMERIVLHVATRGAHFFPSEGEISKMMEV